MNGLVLGATASSVVHLAHHTGSGAYSSLCWHLSARYVRPTGATQADLVTVSPEWSDRRDGRPAELWWLPKVPADKRLCVVCLARYRSADTDLWDWLVATGQVAA